MDPIDSGQGENKPSGQDWDLTPSSKGRQRKRNPKYFDYDTAEKAVVQKTPRRSTRGARKTPEKPPAKVDEAENVTQEAADGEKETTDQTPQESDGKTSEETPKKTPRARKTPAKRTPAKKTPVKRTPGRKTPAKRTPKANGTLPDGEGGVDIGGVGEAGVQKDGVGEAGVGEGGVGEGAVVDGVQQENGAPKPKRKYVRRQQKAAPVTDPPCAEPEEVIEPGGRRRRAAAKAALKYLENLAKEVLHHPGDESGAKPGANSEGSTSPVKEKNTPKGGKGRRSRKRKRGFDSDAEDDEDFVPAAEEYEAEEVEEEEEEEEGDSDLDLNFRTSTGSTARNQSALAVNINRGVWDTIEVTKKFREEHYSSWVFPEWVPTTSSWNLVPPSNVEKYLPQELRSAAFKVSREGLKKEETPLQRLSRFEAVPPHPERWDMLLYTGGPVWATEWCPTPEGAPATQYIAVACHRGMDDQHRANKLYPGPGLVQLWDVGKLEYNTSPDSQPVLAYGLAQDKGFIWHLKWCPAGGWELPSCGRKAPFLPRLGLLAVVTSTGVVTIYSLPHPDALHANKNLPDSGKADQQLPIYQAKGVVTLKLGSFRAPREEQSGQVLSLDWLPEKPHNVMAVGFYDGVVGLWDLSTKSALLRVRESDGSLSLLPYRSFLAHNHCVRALTFCPASRYLLVTAGEDRHIKTWDLRRLDGPIIFLKRYVTNEIYWSLNTPGVLMAQETSYVAKGTHGVHFFDYNMNSLFMIPLTSTLWSISYTDWLNIVATSDDLGEVIIGLLPHKTSLSPYLKRTVERRFPIYLSSMEPHDGGEKENEVVGGAEEGEEERGEAAEEQEGGGGGGGGEVEEREAGSEGGNENRGRRGGRTKYPPLPFQTYKEAAKKYCLHLEDFDLRSVTGIEKRALWKRMRDMEVKTKLNLDEMPLASLHKVRFSPNMSSHTWVVSAGQTGLVRLNCLRSMFSPHVKDIIKKNQAQFNALYSPKPPQPQQPQPEVEVEAEAEAEAVHTDANQL